MIAATEELVEDMVAYFFPLCRLILPGAAELAAVF